MCNEKYVSIEHDRTNGTREYEYMRMRVILSSTFPLNRAAGCPRQMRSWLDSKPKVRETFSKEIRRDRVGYHLQWYKISVGGGSGEIAPRRSDRIRGDARDDVSAYRL